MPSSSSERFNARARARGAHEAERTLASIATHLINMNAQRACHAGPNYGAPTASKPPCYLPRTKYRVRLLMQFV
jgi:hypothetical protein